MQHTVDVIIPSYKPDKKLISLVDSLENQSYPVNKIIIMNTEEAYFDELFYGRKLEDYKNIEVHHISKREFDHGDTRNRGVSYSNADIFICMTQDAIPKDEFLVENLVKGLLQEKGIIAAYARQLPNDTCREIEKFTRKFNYPDTSVIKGQEDIQRLGIKTFFCSNVCAAYHRNDFDYVGGFEHSAIFNEDMIFAGHAVNKGFKIAYVSDAEVIHSHNYTNMQQLHRNFDLGVSQAMHPEVFDIVSSESEGVSMVKEVTKHLFKIGKGYQIFYFYINCGFKYIGYKLGKNYSNLSKSMIYKCTDNKMYWERQE